MCAIFSGVDARELCFVDLPVYDAAGERMSTNITAVRRAGQDNSIDFLLTNQSEYRMTAAGDRLYFPERAISAVVEITMTLKSRVSIKRRVALMGCQQRTSLQFGQADSGADVRTSTIKGRIAGCSTVGDWWIRAMPMFGGHDDPATYEGYIRGKDGVFLLTASLRGERHIIIIGKDKQPIKVLAFDVVVGGQNEIGSVDISGLCPK